MTGFVNDYIQNYPTGLGDPPTYDQYSTIMACYQPQTVPILSTLARQFAVFDHWFCSVPSQTWCNRAFWHAATSWGHVVNGGGDDEGSLEWLDDGVGNTLFNNLSNAGIEWLIYSSNTASLTGLIHFRALDEYHLTNFPSLDQFFTDCQAGQLPPYSFLEPNFWTPHNDQHPSSYDSDDYGPSAVGSVLLDGAAPPAGSFTTIAGTTFSGAQLAVGLGSHTVSAALPVGVFTYGYPISTPTAIPVAHPSLPSRQ